MSKGHSLGRKVQAISRALACQNSDSSSLYFLTGDDKYYSLDNNRNLISVETQKYETLNKESFSKNESRDSSASFLVVESKSFKLTGYICMIFPIFRL